MQVRMVVVLRSLAVAAFGLGLMVLPEFGHSAPALKQGAEKCKKCHKAEHAVWESSPHGKSFRDIHKRDKAGEIATKVGGGNVLGSPKEANARKVISTIGSRDISGAIGPFLPAESEYK